MSPLNVFIWTSGPFDARSSSALISPLKVSTFNGPEASSTRMVPEKVQLLAPLDALDVNLTGKTVTSSVVRWGTSISKSVSTTLSLCSRHESSRLFASIAISESVARMSRWMWSSRSTRGPAHGVNRPRVPIRAGDVDRAGEVLQGQCPPGWKRKLRSTCSVCFCSRVPANAGIETVRPKRPAETRKMARFMAVLSRCGLDGALRQRVHRVSGQTPSIDRHADHRVHPNLVQPAISSCVVTPPAAVIARESRHGRPRWPSDRCPA